MRPADGCDSHLPEPNSNKAMKSSSRLPFLSLALLVMLLAPFATANDDAELTDTLKEIAGAFMTKARAGAMTEADYADEFQQLDAIFEAQADNPGNAAEVLSLKALIYAEILDDPGRAITLLEQIAGDYPGTEAAENSQAMIDFFRQQEEAARMQKLLVVGATFPDFSVQDLDGNDLTLSDYRGKVVLVDFWATWCMPCISELPTLMAAYNRFHADGFEIIGISLDQDREMLLKFLKQQKMSWPQFYDGEVWGNELALKYGIQSIPSSYLLNREGKIIARQLRGPNLTAAVADALAP